MPFFPLGSSRSSAFSVIDTVMRSDLFFSNDKLTSHVGYSHLSESEKEILMRRIELIRIALDIISSESHNNIPEDIMAERDWLSIPIAQRDTLNLLAYQMRLVSSYDHIAGYDDSNMTP